MSFIVYISELYLAGGKSLARGIGLETVNDLKSTARYRHVRRSGSSEFLYWGSKLRPDAFALEVNGLVMGLMTREPSISRKYGDPCFQAIQILNSRAVLGQKHILQSSVGGRENRVALIIALGWARRQDNGRQTADIMSAMSRRTWTQIQGKRNGCLMRVNACWRTESTRQFAGRNRWRSKQRISARTNQMYAPTLNPSGNFSVKPSAGWRRNVDEWMTWPGKLISLRLVKGCHQLGSRSDEHGAIADELSNVRRAEMNLQSVRSLRVITSTWLAGSDLKHSLIADTLRQRLHLTLTLMAVISPLAMSAAGNSAAAASTCIMRTTCTAAVCRYRHSLEILLTNIDSGLNAQTVRAQVTGRCSRTRW